MKYITSSSSNDGSSSIIVTFDASRDIDLAAVDVQNRVNTALARLPVDVRNLGVTITKNSGAFIGAYALFTQDERYDEKFISNYADVYMKDRLKRIPGVADVIIFGERRFSMRLWLDPDRLAARNMSPVDVLTALREQNVQVAAGAVGLPPTPRGQTYQISVRRRRPPGRSVPVRGRRREVAPRRHHRPAQGRRPRRARRRVLFAAVSLERQAGRGPRHTAAARIQRARCEAAASTPPSPELSKEFPPGLVYETAFDTTAPVSASIKDVSSRSCRRSSSSSRPSTSSSRPSGRPLIPAITIPVSLLGTFAFVKLFGFSINTLTLFGLTLATGLVVDDAIVVIENIARVWSSSTFRRARPPRRAWPRSPGPSSRPRSSSSRSSCRSRSSRERPARSTSSSRSPSRSASPLGVQRHHAHAGPLGTPPARRDHGRRPGRRASSSAASTAASTRSAAATRVRSGRVRFRAVTALVFLGLLGATGVAVPARPASVHPGRGPGLLHRHRAGPRGVQLRGHLRRRCAASRTRSPRCPRCRGASPCPGSPCSAAGPNKGAIFCSLIPWEERTGQARTRCRSSPVSAAR